MMLPLSNRSPKRFADRSGRDLLIVAAATLFLVGAFANKAFHIDDPLFIWAAEQIGKTPADFYRFDVNWYGTNAPAYEIIKNPPLGSYFIALVTPVCGWSEVGLHFAFLLPALACTIGTYVLARCFCSRPLVAALCFLIMPGFLVSGTTIMCDTLLLAFWIWALVFWEKGLRTHSVANTILAGSLVAFSALAKYFGVCLIALLLVDGLIRRRRPGIWSVALIIPVVVVALYEWYTRKLCGHGLLSDAVLYSAHLAGRGFWQCTIAALAFTGGCVLAPLCYTHLIWPGRAIVGGLVGLAVLWPVIALTGSGSLLGQINQSHIASVSMQLALLTIGGAFILSLAGMDYWRSRDADSLHLLLWVGGTFVFATFLNWTTNGRAILPMCPAIAILLARRLENPTVTKVRSDWLLIALLLPAAVVSLLVAAADCRLANGARTAASAIASQRTSVLGNLWFQGHWGFQYYMQRVGAKPLDVTHGELENGDLLAVPNFAANVFSIPKEVLRSNNAVQVGPTSWISTMDRSLGAGFYASEWGPLPFSFGPAEPERYDLYSVVHSIRFIPPAEH